jgi:hypothetical protein
LFLSLFAVSVSLSLCFCLAVFLSVCLFAMRLLCGLQNERHQSDYVALRNEIEPEVSHTPVAAWLLDDCGAKACAQGVGGEK